MLIPDELRKCVVFIGYRLPTGEISLQGTAFLAARIIEGTGRSFQYIVTARHVIQGIESKSPDGKVVLRVNFKDGNAYSVESDIESWLFHPDESEVDVAVRPFVNLGEEADVRQIGLSMFVNEEIKASDEIGIGDEVFLTGLFYNHHGKKRNIPVVRVGNIAAMPEERVLTRMGFIDAYLVEARSIGGISGSPVFVHLGLVRRVGGELKYSVEPHGTYYLLGLMHGHYLESTTSDDVLTEDAQNKERVNMGIAIVVPSEKILEVINQPMIREAEDHVEKKLREQMLPTPDSVPEKNEGITQEGFQDALKRASQKLPSSPDEEKNKA